MRTPPPTIASRSLPARPSAATWLTRRALVLAPALAVAALAAGCGSGTASTSPASTQTTAATTATSTTATAPASSARASFVSCLRRAHWHAVGTTVDQATRILATAPGYRGLLTVSDKHGDRVVAVLYGTAQQAEHAQVAAGEAVSGEGHTSSAPGTSIAWINYSGSPRIDQAIAACAAAAAHS